MRPACARRDPDAGVTLIEMLVVLTIFAVVAGSVVLALPGQRASARADLALLKIEARLDAAVDLALATGQGFAIWQEDGTVVLLETGDTGHWVVATNPRLNPVKLSAPHARISFQADDDRVFSVSPALVPATGNALRIVVDGGHELFFDGLRTKRITAEMAE